MSISPRPNARDDETAARTQGASSAAKGLTDEQAREVDVAIGEHLGESAAQDHKFTAERLLDALHDIGWMPCGDSPFWCFCKEPSEPGSHHTDGCITASGILALAGHVGLDADRPYADKMTDSLGRPQAELQAREEAARAR